MFSAKSVNGAKPFIYKSVTVSQIEQENRIFGKNPGFVIQSADETFRINIRPQTSLMLFKVVQTVFVHLDDVAGFELNLGNELLLQLATKEMPYEELLRLPVDVRAVALEVIFEQILDHVDQHSGGQSSFHSPDHISHREALNFSYLLTLTGQNNQERTLAQIRTDAQGADWLAAHLKRLPHAIDNDLGSLPMTGRVEAGRTELSFTEVRNLAPFDIVMTDSLFNQDNPEVRVRFSQQCVLIAAVVQPNQILIQDIHPFETELPGMIPDEIEIHEPSGPPLGDIPVELVFEIGAIRIPLGKLRQLQPGFTLQPAASIDPHKPVIIRANGVAVGHGEIIRIEDRLGIRILDFNGGPISE